MADSRQAWDRVGQDFTDLGQHVRRHYEQQAQAGQPAPEDRRKVEAALRQLRDSLDQAFTALGDAIRDPQFGEQAKKTANSLGEALSSTFTQVGQRLGSKSQREDRSAEDG
jgi:Flp pilus assembly pilin Flp